MRVGMRKGPKPKHCSKQHRPGVTALHYKPTSSFPKVTLSNVNCGWQCSLDISLWTGVKENIINIWSQKFFLQGAGNFTFSFIIEHSVLILRLVSTCQSLRVSTNYITDQHSFFQNNNNIQPFSSLPPFLFISFLTSLIMWLTVHPVRQEQSPVMWWQVPPFWQGQRCSHWGPWLPEGQRSPQLSPHMSRVKCLRHIACVRLQFFASTKKHSKSTFFSPAKKKSKE